MTHKPTLLVVEDEPAVRQLLATVLAPDYDLLLACDGSEAMQQYQTHGPRIAGIITDLNMPRVSGTVFLAWLAQQPRAVPVLVVSSAVGQVDKAPNQIDTGRVAWLAKPFRLEDLRAAVITLVA